MNGLQISLLVPAIATALTFGAAAQADMAGESQYRNACASCHGESGKGDGHLAGFLSIGLPDLTTLAQQNDGEFPMLKVIHIIDGRTGTRGHGGEMPVWGDRFSIEIENPGPYGAEVIIRGRILSLAYYLESIQQ